VVTTVVTAARPGGDSSREPARGPVIVLSYPHAGTEVLTRMLSASPSLACTSSSGLLPLCQAAAVTWRQVENRDTASALAIKSIRTLATTMVAVIQSRSGATRWCETAFAPAAAATFLQVFPEATFLSFHRRLQGVLAEGIRTYPWGLGGSPFWPYSGPHPGNNAATVAAYWAACTEALLEFETAHPLACLRIRYEDIIESRQRQAREIFGRLGLPAADLRSPGDPRVAEDLAGAEGDGASPGSPVPTTQLPPQLLARIRELHARLDYPLPPDQLPQKG
jgi:hypothetical protein